MDVTNFFFGKNHPLEDLGGGIKRRMAAYNENAMCVEVHFDTGAVAALPRTSGGEGLEVRCGGGCCGGLGRGFHCISVLLPLPLCECLGVGALY